MRSFIAPFIRALAVLALLAAAMPANACESEMFQAFREIAGSWQVFRDGRLAGDLEMRPVADGCAMLEDWQTVEGVKAVALHWPGPAETETPEAAVEEATGLSAEESDAPETVLHQVYVDSNGWSIRADGSISEGVLVYEGTVMEDGQELVLRATLRGIGSDEIVHVGEMSTDAGETWQDSFTLVYRRKAK